MYLTLDNKLLFTTCSPQKTARLVDEATVKPQSFDLFFFDNLLLLNFLGSGEKMKKSTCKKREREIVFFVNSLFLWS